MTKLTTLSLLGGVALSSNLVAGEVSPVQEPAADNYKIALGYHTQYVDRGQHIAGDLVTAELGTAITCPLSGLDISFDLWYGSSDDATRVITGGNDLSMDELRLSAGTSYDLGFASIHSGYTFYTYFGDADDIADDHEFYFGFHRDICGFATSLTYFWGIDGDFRGNNEGYTELDISRTYDLGGYALATAVTTGYLVEEGAFSHITLQVSHDIEISDNAKLTPYIAQSFELDDLERSIGGANPAGFNADNEFFAGAKLSVTF